MTKRRPGNHQVFVRSRPVGAGVWLFSVYRASDTHRTVPVTGAGDNPVGRRADERRSRRAAAGVPPRARRRRPRRHADRPRPHVGARACRRRWRRWRAAGVRHRHLHRPHAPERAARRRPPRPHRRPGRLLPGRPGRRPRERGVAPPRAHGRGGGGRGRASRAGDGAPAQRLHRRPAVRGAGDRVGAALRRARGGRHRHRGRPGGGGRAPAADQAGAGHVGGRRRRDPRRACRSAGADAST